MAIEAAFTRFGTPVIREEDVEARMASTFRALPTPQSQFAISNVHRATQQFLESLDPRLHVRTSYESGNQTFQIFAKQDVTVQLSWTSHDPDHTLEAITESLESGHPLLLNVASISLRGSPLLEHLTQSVGPGQLHVVPISSEVSLRLMTKSESGRFDELLITDGSLTLGTKRFTIHGAFLDGLVNVKLTVPLSKDLDEKTQFSIALDYSQWEGCDIRTLKGFNAVRDLFEILKREPKVSIEAFFKNGNRLSDLIDFAEHQGYIGSHLRWLRYVGLARHVADHFDATIRVLLSHQISRQEYQTLYDVVETLEGRKTNRQTLHELVKITIQITEEFELPSEGLELAVEIHLEEPKQCEVFGSIVPLPPLFVVVEGHARALTPRRYYPGESTEIFVRMGGSGRFRFFFKEDHE